MKPIIFLTILVSAKLLCFGQTDKTKIGFERIQLTSTYESRLYVWNADGKLMEFDATKGEGVIIQNSFPKGGKYTDPSGKTFGYRIFWTRVINETATPLELSINFPADSFAILPSPDAYLKLFLPPDTMALTDEILYEYGVTGLELLLDTGLNKPTTLQRIINPKEEGLFYIGVLMYWLPDQATGTRRAGLHQTKEGVIRTGLVLKEQGLLYRISIAGELDSALIPCGYITRKL